MQKSISSLKGGLDQLAFITSGSIITIIMDVISRNLVMYLNHELTIL